MPSVKLLFRLKQERSRKEGNIKIYIKMKQLLQLSLVIAFFLSCAGKQNNIGLLKPAQFSQAMKKEKEFILLDVRTPEEYNSGKLANSLLIDYHSDDFRQQLEKLDKNVPCYIYCRSGNRSHKAAVMMEEMGFVKVVDLDGGIIAWEEAGMEVE